MKHIKVKIIYERTCSVLPENYDGETDIEKMKEVEREQMKDGMILMDMVMNAEPEIEVTVEEI